MRPFALILLLLPCLAQASCTDNNDPAYNLSVSQGDYQKAFQIVARELRLSLADQKSFKIVPGFSDTHDDRHGQSDPDNLEARLDPGLFIEGKEGACQGIAHELTHLRQFQRDRRRLHEYFSKHPVPEAGWNGCERDSFSRSDSLQAENAAYACLQDNDLAPHSAADDIEAVLAQIPYASGRLLRNEDLSYLADNLSEWANHQSMVSDHANESYYLPEIKREDIRIFCRGFDQARARRANTAPALQAWQYFCRVRH